jgi:hypothetical protein
MCGAEQQPARNDEYALVTFDLTACTCLRMRYVRWNGWDVGTRVAARTGDGRLVL